MMERMLIFSLEHQRPIRVMYMEQGRLKQATGIVTALQADHLLFRKTRAKAEMLIRHEDLLSADFKKGDEGQVDA